MDRRHFLRAAAALTAVGPLVGCAAPASEPDPDPTAPTPAADALKALHAGNRRFACEFLAAAGKPADNLIASPLGVSTVFAMLSHGARAKTLDQLRAVLHLPADDVAVAGGFAELARQVNASRKAGGAGFELSAANAVWGQKGYPWRPEYVETLKRGYAAGVREVDYARDTEGARKAINAWAAAQTRDKIQELIDPGVLDADTRMVLANAVYFKSKWEREFDPKATRPAPFVTAAGAKVDAPLMFQEARFALLETDGFQAIELPYKTKAASLLVFLPRTPDGLPAFETQFTAANLATWAERPWPTADVQAHLPKWTVETAIDLKRVLPGMGMPDIFTSAADLSGMAGGDRLHVGAAAQKAFIDVNEEGTEAAAATYAAAKRMSGAAKEYVFRADHPFVYAIRHNPTGTLLFVGRVTNPKGGA